MKHIDLFGGLGGFALAASWVWGDEYKNIGHSEIEHFPCKVYHHHFPESECLGDIKKIDFAKFKEHPDLLTAGFPCQNLSIAGNRKGLAGTESGLFWELARGIGISLPHWFILENVPGLLSSNERKDMWSVITTLEQFGYCVAWRIFDAKYFGVAQQRRRVWIVGSLGNTGAVKVLFEQESGRRNDSPEQEVGARGLCISTRDGGRQDPTNETLIACSVGVYPDDKYPPSQNARRNIIASTLRASGTGDHRTMAHGRSARNIIAYTINAGKRGNAGRLWEDTHIAEINPTGKREIDGLSRQLYSDSARGKALGNSIVPQVAAHTMRAIKNTEEGK